MDRGHRAVLHREVAGLLHATVLPVALLLVLLHALIQHARHNEITAMRAAGIVWRQLAPYLVVGFPLTSLRVVYLNEQWEISDADGAELNRRGARARPVEIQSPYRTNGFRECSRWHIFGRSAPNTETMVMTFPVLTTALPDGSPVLRESSGNGVWVKCENFS